MFSHLYTVTIFMYDQWQEILVPHCEARDLKIKYDVM